jgi:hypothetical protein
MRPVRSKRPRSPRLQIKKVDSATPLDMWVPQLEGQVEPPRSRVLSPTEESQLLAQTRDWLTAKVIEQTTAKPWVNNPVSVPKKNGTIRVCIDCRPVNRITKDFNWPLPKLQELRHHLKGNKWFSRIDLKDAFFRIGIPKEFRPYTAYACRGNYYQFRRMPFGLKTAPSIFQRFMDHALAPARAVCLWYMDDILIGGATLPQLREHTKRVKKLLATAQVEINHNKSEYEKKTILFAGITCQEQGTSADPLQLQTLLSKQPPTTKKEKQSALGLVSYLRDFIPLLGHFTAELYPGKGEALPTNQYHQQWNRLIEHVFESTTTLNHWNEHENARLYTDASGLAAAAVLIQNGRIISVVSRKLKGAETRYSTTDREHLSLVLAAQRFRIFLHRPRGVTEVFNDHAALLNRSTNHMLPRQYRWNEIISTWIPTIKHVKGENNPADWFSRWGCGVEGGRIFV